MISQQIMRQDPAYYLLYVLLRPDHAHTLISYPYYAKYAVPGDRMEFYHIDLDVSWAVHEGRGINLIQGSLSLDTESEEGCTVVIPGLHQHLPEWLQQVESCGGKLSNNVCKITKKEWNVDDKDYFGMTWTPYPCNAFDVCVLHPGLPHGSSGPAPSQ